MAINQYKQFRDIKQAIGSNLLTKRYDEPTYLTFRALFGEDFASWSGVTLLNTNYDKIPHPLFNPIQVDATKEQKGGNTVIEFNRDFYSTIDFLRDSNEFTRAEMLKEFIVMWNDLQKNFQYYFRSIEGLGDLLRPSFEKGRRVSSDLRLTFNMAEGLDQRVTHLLNLYKKIAWDDTYQRWVLPDIMRYFSIKIYVTEFRTFHRSTLLDKADQPTQTQQKNIYNYGGGTGIIDNLSEKLKYEQIKKGFTHNLGAKPEVGYSEPNYLQVLNGILPTHLIECEMCEFDIENFNYSARDNLSVYDEPTEATVSFQIKVGNVNEIQTYPLFKHYILNDYKLNGLDRSKEKGFVKSKDGKITNADQAGYPPRAKMEVFASSQQGDPRYMNMDRIAQDTYSQKEMHESGGKPWILKDYTPSDLVGDLVDSVEPATWVGNAITFGKAFGVNFVTEYADKYKMTKIPGLGFSFNDAVAAIESKSFISVLGLVRRAINDSIGGTEPPSSQLDEKIDATFKEFLSGVILSEATDGDEIELVKMANQALSDGGTWDAIKDFSLATNLVGPNEVDKSSTIKGADQYKQIVAETTNNDRSIATDLDGDPTLDNTGLIFEAPPSRATNNDIQKK